MTNLTTTKQTFTTAELFKEIPLACLSFLYFQSMKFAFGNLYNFHLHRNNQKFEWQPLSTETLKSPFTLPFWMTFGPRLNTHAIIAPVGPLRVNHSVDIDIESAENSAKSWTIAVYQFPGYKTITRISSTDFDFKEKWKKLKLPPGNYMLGLRYYDWVKNVELPAVKVDESAIVKAKTISGDTNKFYAELRTKQNWFYTWLNYYVFTVLCLKSWLPQSFVRKQFLPVGDSSLIYYYGIFKNKESIKLTLDAQLFKSYNMYLTLYDRSSFVLDFYQIDKQSYTTLSSRSDGFYLIRIRQKSGIKDKFVKDWIDIEIV